MSELFKTRAYALKLKDSQELRRSSSGGAFTAFTNEFLSNGNAVVSAVYNYNNAQTEFVLYEDYQTRDSARGSKYMQSYPLDVFREAEDWLRNNHKNLIFFGSGCQADGFRKYMEKKGLRERVTVVGIICHGFPSPMIWKDYIKEKGDYKNLSFRDKRNGWDKPYAHMEVNGKEISVQNYLTIFYNKCALRPACYECRYATTERNVDLTIGDFWGIEKALPEFDKNGGVSLVLVHSQKGQELFEKIKGSIEWQESDVNKSLQPNLVKPTERSARREEFWNDYKSFGINKILKKYAPKPSIFKRAILKVKGFVSK
jgi:coenzyme F420-reducing hydrogenase beta subunit